MAGSNGPSTKPTYGLRRRPNKNNQQQDDRLRQREEMGENIFSEGDFPETRDYQQRRKRLEDHQDVRTNLSTGSPGHTQLDVSQPLYPPGLPHAVSSSGRWLDSAGTWHDGPSSTPGGRTDLEEDTPSEEEPPSMPSRFPSTEAFSSPPARPRREEDLSVDLRRATRGQPFTNARADEEGERPESSNRRRSRSIEQEEPKSDKRPLSPTRRSSRLIEQEAKAAGGLVDEIGIVPKKCRTLARLEDTPPQIADLRAAILHDFSLTRSFFGTRAHAYPVNEVFREWGRQWIIKTSTIPKGEAIKMPQNRSIKYIPLFPYVGAIFTLKQFDQIAPWYPNMRRYALQVVKGTYKDDSQLVIVGDAREDHNLAAFINSNQNIEDKTGPPNCEWQYMDNTFSECLFKDRKTQKYLDIIQQQSQIRIYAMTVARKNIADGDEIFATYDYRNT